MNFNQTHDDKAWKLIPPRRWGDICECLIMLLTAFEWTIRIATEMKCEHRKHEVGRI